ncbi:MAG TPA: hypothetical protein VEI54_07645 [Candidatus Limnocylindrales bacterium]|nr:hypothetical protein [Candidatus Limnocylindrales bacterium]
MKHFLCAILVLLSLALVACGGGGPTIIPPPPAGNFSNASLKGQYAFSMTGVDAVSGAYIARIGSFVADGAGNITGGLEDVLSLATGQPAAMVSFSGGTYEIQANGRGLLVLQASGGGGLQLNLAMQSTSAGFLVQTDLNASTSGTFNLQNSANFSNAALSGNYVFDFSGVSFSAVSVAPISMMGQLTADGNGMITGGVMDTNDGNAAAPSGATAISPGTYLLDTNGNGTSFGRGTLAFNGSTFAFYIVDATRIKVLEEDNSGGTSGDALQQVAPIPAQNSAFTGSFVYLVGGASVLGSQGPVARAARFTADGNGGLGAISFDDNNFGLYRHVSQGTNISNAIYAIDVSDPGSGRGTFTFTDSSGGTYSNVFYMVSASRAFVQDTSNGIIGDGPMYAQTGGPFNLSGSAGNYVFNWSGVQFGSSTAVPFEEDFVGQFALSSSTLNNVSGVTDYVELGINSNKPYTDVGLGGTLTMNGDGTANNLYKFTLGGSPSTTINFQAYFVNASTVLLVCSDSNRTTAGIINPQSQ